MAINKKNSNILLITLILAAVLIGLYFLKSFYGLTRSVPEQASLSFESKYSPFPTPSVDTSTWNIYYDPILKFSIKYPSEVMIDPGAIGTGEFVAFIFKDEDWRNLPRNSGGYEKLEIYDRGGVGKSAFETFKNVECGEPCKKKEEEARKVKINNAYGINLSNNLGYNFYLTDKDEKGNTIRVILDTGFYPRLDKNKLFTLESMMKTLKFDR